ncbi:hypothetical protein CPB86DRAFT_788217 [Serendipita vermifera]|nr:hypothetical protein CPB86DRAFT_788217 [Serendipita vermifera]
MILLLSAQYGLCYPNFHVYEREGSSSSVTNWKSLSSSSGSRPMPHSLDMPVSSLIQFRRDHSLRNPRIYKLISYHHIVNLIETIKSIYYGLYTATSRSPPVRSSQVRLSTQPIRRTPPDMTDRDPQPPSDGASPPSDSLHEYPAWYPQIDSFELAPVAVEPWELGGGIGGQRVRQVPRYQGPIPLLPVRYCQPAWVTGTRSLFSGFMIYPDGLNSTSLESSSQLPADVDNWDIAVPIVDEVMPPWNIDLSYYSPLEIEIPGMEIYNQGNGLPVGLTCSGEGCSNGEPRDNDDEVLPNSIEVDGFPINRAGPSVRRPRTRPQSDSESNEEPPRKKPRFTKATR